MEYFDVCDEKGIPTGEVVERSVAHSKGIRHRTAHVWILREEQGRTQVLLQKRSANKDSYPGRYDSSSAGHVQSLILACTLIIIGVLILIMGIMADTIAANRKILQDIQYHVKRIEYRRDDEE